MSIDCPDGNDHRLPYPTTTERYSHPECLAVLAHILGYEVPTLRGARILEIGCADGTNLLPMAYTLAEAELTGIDVSDSQIQRARQDASALGLRARFETIDILDYDCPSESFDFIIAHGFYSWVPEHVRAHLMAQIAHGLTPTGLAYVSYNTYPGWHEKQATRDFLLFMTESEKSQKSMAENASALARHMAHAYGDFAYPKAAGLAKYAAMFARLPPAYLAHGPLSSTNSPIYFDDFVARANKHGLHYVADAEHGWVTEDHPLFGHFGLSHFVTEHPEKMEQVLDFLENKSFRRSILTKSRQKPMPSPQKVPRLFLSSQARVTGPEHDLEKNDNIHFEHSDKPGIEVEIADPFIKTLMIVLAEIPRQRFRYSTLIKEVEQRRGHVLDHDSEEALWVDLVKLFSHGLLGLHLQCPSALTLDPDASLMAHPMSRYLSERQDEVPNYEHESVRINAVQGRLLRLMDGTLTLTQLLDVLEQADEGPLSNIDREHALENLLGLDEMSLVRRLINEPIV